MQQLPRALFGNNESSSVLSLTTYFETRSELMKTPHSMADPRRLCFLLVRTFDNTVVSFCLTMKFCRK
jgi:hypothetical protein